MTSPRHGFGAHDCDLLSFCGLNECLDARLEFWRLRSEEHTSELQSLRHLMPSSALRSEEHTSELQSLRHLVCRLLLEKKKISRHALHRRARSCLILLHARIRRSPCIGPRCLVLRVTLSHISLCFCFFFFFFFKERGPPQILPFSPPPPSPV